MATRAKAKLKTERARKRVVATSPKSSKDKTRPSVGAVKTPPPGVIRPVLHLDALRHASTLKLKSIFPKGAVANIALPRASAFFADDAPAGQVLHSATTIGALVRAYREAHGLSQQRFADAAGVGRRFLSELENGKPSLEFDKVLDVARAAGIEIFAVSKS